MERELWRRMVRALRRVPRRWPTRGWYDNRQVLAVLLWAALHDRPVSWACRRENWPMQAWRRRLPDQSTMSRRLRDPLLTRDLWRLVRIIQQRWGAASGILILDGKPMTVSFISGDPDATIGWGAGRHQKGYKLHTLIDSARRLLTCEVHPMNVAECTVAVDLLTSAHEMGLLPEGATVLADPSFDSNPLHATAERTRVRLIAPRRKPDRSISRGHRQHPGRLASIEVTEGPAANRAAFHSQRGEIERYFGTLSGSGGGLTCLPAWV